MPSVPVRRPPWPLSVPFVFALVVVSFSAATIYSQYKLEQIDRAAMDIAEDASPSIELLAAARTEVERIQVLVREYEKALSDGQSPDVSSIGAPRTTVGLLIDAYVALPAGPEEKALWGAILSSRGALEAAIDRVLSARGDARAQLSSLPEIRKTGVELSDALMADVTFNARYARDLAAAIRKTRIRYQVLALLLDGACALMTILGVLAVWRSLRSYAELSESRTRLSEERARELGQFADRVAHDVLSPLAATALSLRVIGNLSESAGLDLRKPLEGGRAGLNSVRRIVDDLLGFAKAGARPRAGARAHVGEILAELVSELEPAAAQAGIELCLLRSADCWVGCEPGILTTLVANLAGNSIKYMGDGDRKRVAISVKAQAPFARVEVEDTGPGIPPGLGLHVFEPYVRGAAAGQPGIGLGLATVKRIAEAHGGAVGAESQPGAGSRFWFTLPLADDPSGGLPGV